MSINLNKSPQFQAIDWSKEPLFIIGNPGGGVLVHVAGAKEGDIFSVVKSAFELYGTTWIHCKKYEMPKDFLYNLKTLLSIEVGTPADLIKPEKQQPLKKPPGLFIPRIHGNA